MLGKFVMHLSEYDTFAQHNRTGSGKTRIMLELADTFMMTGWPYQMQILCQHLGCSGSDQICVAHTRNILATYSRLYYDITVLAEVFRGFLQNY